MCWQVWQVWQMNIVVLASGLWWRVSFRFTVVVGLTTRNDDVRWMGKKEDNKKNRIKTHIQIKKLFRLWHFQNMLSLYIFQFIIIVFELYLVGNILILCMLHNVEFPSVKKHTLNWGIREVYYININLSDIYLTRREDNCCFIKASSTRI